MSINVPKLSEMPISFSNPLESGKYIQVDTIRDTRFGQITLYKHSRDGSIIFGKSKISKS